MVVGRVNGYVDLFRYYGMGQGETPERKEEDVKEAKQDILAAEKKIDPISPLREDSVYFLSLEALSSALKQCTSRELQGLVYCSAKARFVDTLCPESTALSFEDTVLHANEVGKDFFPHRLIASQAPLEKDHELFWQVVLKNSPVIFDLTRVGEVYTKEKPYYPSQLEETLCFGAVSVTLVKATDDIYTYEVKNDEQTSYITRYHYDAWPDYGVVSLEELEDLIEQVERLAFDQEKPLWVHCKAGVGRTGSLLACLMLKKKILSGQVTKNNLDQAIISLIVDLRKERGPKFVTSPDQLDLVRSYGLYLLGIRR